MNENEVKAYEEKVKKYKNALNYVYTDGTVSGAERTILENLKNELGLTTDECRNFEQPYVLAKKAQEEAKQLIENFTFDTSMSTPTFEDLKNVGIFAGKWEDPYTHQKLDVNVTANLIHPSITTTVNNTPIFSEEFENLQDMIALSLSSLQEEKFMNIHKDNPIIKDLREDFAYDIQKEAQKVLDESFGEDIEANISKSAIYIPSDYGFEKDNKIHILLEVNSNEREDELFNALAKKGFTLPDGTEVDFNPITPKEHGSIEEYLEHLQHLNENERWKKNNKQTVKTENKLSDEDVISSFKEKLKRDVKKYDLDTQVSCVLDSAKSVLKGFSNEEKKIIGKWLMDSGADSPIALQKKLENLFKFLWTHVPENSRKNENTWLTEQGFKDKESMFKVLKSWEDETAKKQSQKKNPKSSDDLFGRS